MSHTLLERAAVPVPATRDLRREARRFAPAGLVLLIAAGAAAYGHHWWTVGRFIESTDDAYVGGEVTAIAPKVSGLIAQVLVTDNQTVRACELLVKIDDRDYRAALDKATGAVEAQRATLANLDATGRLQEAMIAQAEAEVARSGFDVVRYRHLAADQFASTQRLQQADADSKKALAGAGKAKAAVAAAQRRLDVIDTQKQQTQAALTQANQELARLNLGYTELRAPIDGVIGNRSARVGAYATLGAQLLSLVPARGLLIDANLKESQLGHMRAGMPVTIAAEEIHGHVISLAPATGAQFSILPPENATGNFTKIVQRVPVRIALDDDADALGRLRPGLSVTASVDERPSR
jgi:membrane fusion protein, multidrug efflux system